MEQESGEMVGMTMHMTVKWIWNISFIFQSWSVKEDQTLWICVGLLLSVVLSAISVITPAFKTKITKSIFKKNQSQSLLIKQSQSDIEKDQNEAQAPTSLPENIFNFIYIFIYSLFHIGTMMLIMTYNGFVIIAVIIGLTLGYTICPMEGDKDKNLPINCCA